MACRCSYCSRLRRQRQSNDTTIPALTFAIASSTWTALGSAFGLLQSAVGSGTGIAPVTNRRSTVRLRFPPDQKTACKAAQIPWASASIAA